MAALDAELKQIANELEGRLANDNGVPRNIRKGASNAVELLLDNSKAMDLRISSAINILADLSNDPNIPMESWSSIMQILSNLEIMLKKLGCFSGIKPFPFQKGFLTFSSQRLYPGSSGTSPHRILYVPPRDGTVPRRSACPCI